ncbi:MAG TPA: 50S ribosomal protein L25 [Bacteroidales bacterium]|nr:MAG: 50S ribosomal protein L25/general stress protein Ctc [Bacteroidetes bacterium GWF2_33_38]OFY73792.1 MAG: 50S ribosomal protein L25/general stress protein Ctc [Bacteroidetes bacterium RIFOXYA12_FULL_33_9]OFY88681.1 MAG: 50S ribosomal protein L25/general stress protein Ctc [Bacteroidetes bacterium RIFOXYA2_FULL_33_7]HBF89156.1 50S ribosomal protein L25 [Bacteroidales bacterium]
MKTLELKVKTRTEIGKKSTKQLRKQGNVPCELYGGKDNLHFYAFENDFLPLVYTPNAYLVKLDIEGKEHHAVLKDLQFHPVSDKLLHIDFLQIFDDKPVTIAVPVKLNGFAKGVKDGGKLNLESKKLNIKALPKHLPDLIELNVDDLGLGKTIKVRDLKYDNFELVDFPNTVIASVKLTRAAKGAVTEEGAAATTQA